MDESRFLHDRPRSHPNFLPLVLALRSHMTLAQRKRFFERLHAVSTGKVSPLCDPSMTREQVYLNAEAFSELALRVARQRYRWLEGRIR